jgi:hypothetical protein
MTHVANIVQNCTLAGLTTQREGMPSGTADYVSCQETSGNQWFPGHGSLLVSLCTQC